MGEPIGLAIIGSGIFVEEQHLPAVQKNKHLQLKAIYSRSSKSAQKVSQGVSGIDLYSDDSSQGKERDIDALLARTDVQAVIIALPIPVQPAFIKKALAAGKHVLAEKPLANDVETGKQLIDYYRSSSSGASKLNFSIAEQFRYLPVYNAGAKKVGEFGSVVGLRVRMHTCIQQGMKYIETPWRKKPTHQGGFLLDGGVHFIAGIRLLLAGSGEKVKSVSAFTTLLQDYLPPVDTVDATWRLSNGSTGTFSVSFGTTFAGSEWRVAGEGGVVTVKGETLSTIVKGGEEESETLKEEGLSVQAEVDAWAASLVEGKPDPRQSPEEALADLEILEAMIKSGEAGGKPIELRYQL